MTEHRRPGVFVHLALEGVPGTRYAEPASGLAALLAKPDRWKLTEESVESVRQAWAIKSFGE